MAIEATSKPYFESLFTREEQQMFLIRAGDIEIENSKPLELKGQSQDFEKAKQKANKLLKSFAQVEIIESETKECVHFQTRK